MGIMGIRVPSKIRVDQRFYPRKSAGNTKQSQTPLTYNTAAGSRKRFEIIAPIQDLGLSGLGLASGGWDSAYDSQGGKSALISAFIPANLRETTSIPKLH